MTHSEPISPPGFPSLAVTGRGFALIGLLLLMTGYRFTFASASGEKSSVPVLFWSSNLSQLSPDVELFIIFRLCSVMVFSK